MPRSAKTFSHLRHGVKRRVSGLIRHLKRTRAMLTLSRILAFASLMEGNFEDAFERVALALLHNPNSFWAKEVVGFVETVFRPR